MNPPYTSLRQLVEATLEKFKEATSLSRTDQDGCRYDTTINGIGCAIGCHFPPDVTSQWDFPEVAANTIIEDLIYEEPEVRQEIAKVIDLDAISTEELIALQNAHDQSENVATFRTTLRRYLETEDVQSMKIYY